MMKKILWGLGRDLKSKTGVGGGTPGQVFHSFSFSMHNILNLTHTKINVYKYTGGHVDNYIHK